MQKKQVSPSIYLRVLLLWARLCQVVCRMRRALAPACAMTLVSLLLACGTSHTTPPSTPSPGSQPTQLLYANGQAASGTGMTQTAFRVESDGSLTSLGTALQTSNSIRLAVADATGHHVFGSDSSTSSGPLLTFSVEPNSGALQQTSSAALPPSATFTSEPVLNPASTFMFLGLTVGQSGMVASYVIATYSVDSAGNLALVPAVDGSAGTSVPLTPGALVVNPSGTFLYVALQSHSVSIPATVIQFAIDSAGRLTEVSSVSLPSVGINVPTGIAMTLNGSTLYVQMFSPTVVAFAVDSSTGNLTQKATVACNCGNADEGGGLVVNSKGTLLFEGVGGESFGDAGVALYSIDQSTGALTPLSNSFIAIGSAGAPSFALDSSGPFLYATGILSNFKGFSVTDSGVVSPVPGSPFAQSVDTVFTVNFKP
jgi:6-phosphogluconolactonase (cycloisomerase 2 family)